jgi:hypothetical protein
MRRSNESGEGKFGTIVGFLVLGAVLMAGWNVIPVYYANYTFTDKLIEFARLDRNNKDEDIMKKMQVEARDLKIDQYINTDTCRIVTQERSRRISCKYARTVTVVPGYKHTFRFENEAEQPLLY